jgi:hypothetical protein
MSHKRKPLPPDDLSLWFREHAERLWPLALGSLSFRKAPCVRPGCARCASGEGHPSWVLFGKAGGKRFGVYVPEELVPEIRAAIERGRQMQDLLYDSGRRYLQALKAQRKTDEG